MANPTAVILVVGLSRSLISTQNTPRIDAFAREGSLVHLQPVLPAVTCAAQSSMLTGLHPHQHGVVGNGWYDRELCEVQFWKQSNRLVHGEKVWETARRRDPSVTCANICWWFNMYSSVDVAITPRPIYTADGLKVPDCWTQPAEWREQVQAQLGRFPLFQFWGPGASIVSSRWIADATILTHRRFNPTLTLVYLPHLDYALQKLGPDHPDIPAHCRDVDAEVGKLLDYFRGAGVTPIIVSEYGIEAVDDAVHVNRALREAGLLRVREERGGELLDPGASDAFAVSDHQVAHVYVNNPAKLGQTRELCHSLPGVESVVQIDHRRAGDFTLVAAPRRWFSYDYWLDDAKAPDFAPTVEIHRKPGYDPLELFLDPRKKLPKLRIAWKLLRRKLGFRTLMDVVPCRSQDTRLVRGSHGRANVPDELKPVLITAGSCRTDNAPCTAVRDIILEHLFRT